jgi:hypothetical protein
MNGFCSWNSIKYNDLYGLIVYIESFRQFLVRWGQGISSQKLWCALPNRLFSYVKIYIAGAVWNAARSIPVQCLRMSRCQAILNYAEGQHSPYDQIVRGGRSEWTSGAYSVEGKKKNRSAMKVGK